MTTLEQFNEEVKEALAVSFLKGAAANEPLAQTQEDTIYFVMKKLTAHKELILKMVREKILKDARLDALAIDNIEDDLDELGRIF